ncbi:MAG: allantoate amidohydrolase [Acidobacteriota bacterium]
MPKSPASAILRRCDELSRISEEPDRLTRGFLSPAMDDATTLVARWMQEAGLDTELDAAGNLIGTRRSERADAPIFVMGSHLDTVRDAGRYDGVLGVLLAIDAAHRIGGRGLPFDLEVIAFADEEGLRFGAPFLGSKALIGELGDDLLELYDADGDSLREVIDRWNRDQTGAPAADIRCRYAGRRCLGYLEAHIEQGPSLEESGVPLGVLEALACSWWLRLRFSGRAGHAGTTPMALRRDPMPAAAALVLEAERIALATPDLVATVGRLEATPGAGNVIPGDVEMTLDVRHPDADTLSRAVDELLSAAASFAAKRGLGLTSETLHREAGVTAAPELSRLLEAAAADADVPVDRLVVGAGHDALIMARRMPISMLLLRSPGGVSHHPDEAVEPGDVDDAARVMLRLLERLADGSAWDGNPARAADWLNSPATCAATAPEMDG